MEPIWLTRARSYIGQREIAGVKNNPLILHWWVLIHAAFNDDETPWCAGFVGGVLEECGIRSSRSAAARSYLKWGRELKGPAVGAIVVFERGPVNGHVGFVVGRDAAGNLLVLGGNQGDMVRISPFRVSRLLGYRWPADVMLPPVQGLKNLPLVKGAGPASENEA